MRRKTKETDVEVIFEPYGNGNYKIKTPLPFFNHLLEAFAKHGNFDLRIKAKGDIEVDPHHLLEDVGIVLGSEIKKKIRKRGINRYGNFLMPMDEALSYIVVDISGRGHLEWDVEFGKRSVIGFDLNLLEEFFLGLVRNSNITVHISLKKGKNSHHIAESIFKGFGKALSDALRITSTRVPSTKGKI